jgi:2,3-bisphosphoglycerate-independent phosphoglycerate mutase
VSLKRVVLVPDGMADEPLEELGGRTPLEAAATPNMDRLAAAGTVGLVRTVPEGMAAGSDVANLAVLGYDPAAVYTGRAPLEAASIGVELGRDDVAFRANLVTIAGGVMVDFTAGHIAGPVAGALMRRLDHEFDDGPFEFHPGVSYRNLMVWRGGVGAAAEAAACTPPHDILDRPVAGYLPRGEAGAALVTLMGRAREVIEGLSEATDVWLWGQGRAPTLPTFRELRGLDAAVVGAVDLVKGIGRYAGMEVVEVPGATGDLDTDYGAKARAALEALGRRDLVFVHVEAPDEAGHMGDVTEKVRAIERVDTEVLGPILESAYSPAVLVLPDHPTPIRLRTHVATPVPFAFGAAASALAAAPNAFGERAAAATGTLVPDGPALMDRFLAFAGSAGPGSSSER